MLVREGDKAWQATGQVEFLASALKAGEEIRLGLGRTALGSTVDALVPPACPDPTAFGIESGYFDRAVDGARRWERRQRLLPEAMRCSAMCSAVSLGMVISLAVFPVAALGLGTVLVLIAISEAVHDSWLKRHVYNPTYNPEPDAYERYAVERARYETEVSTVYVSHNWLYHSRPYCGRMQNSWVMLKWEAVVRGAKPCCHCGHFSVRPKALPRPFGSGCLPEEVSCDGSV